MLWIENSDRGSIWRYGGVVTSLDTSTKLHKTSSKSELTEKSRGSCGRGIGRVVQCGERKFLSEIFK